MDWTPLLGTECHTTGKIQVKGRVTSLRFVRRETLQSQLLQGGDRRWGTDFGPEMQAFAFWPRTCHQTCPLAPTWPLEAIFSLSPYCSILLISLHLLFWLPSQLANQLAYSTHRVCICHWDFNIHLFWFLFVKLEAFDVMTLPSHSW